VNIRTDIIVGFPGETRNEFIETAELIEKTAPDITNISKFGAMKGTPAAMMCQLEDSIISKRTRELSSLCRSITLERNMQQVGDTRKIFVSETYKKGILLGRDEYFRQVALQDSDAKVGEFVKREIKSASLFGLSAF
jgi:tRNA A37 methylthiotransferase MiaB